MKNVLIIGAGLSGLSAAVNLCSQNFNITILESSPKFGGRCSSIKNQNTNSLFDNGQHIMMSCYHDTIDFLKKIDAFDKIKIQKNLEVNFVSMNRKIHKLSIPEKYYPFNLLYGFLNYTALSFKERLKVIDFFLDLICCFEEDLKELTVKDWLRIKNQSDNTIKSFWEILCVGIMNSLPENASAELLAYVLKEIFLSGNNNFRIVLPKVSLSELFIDTSLKYLSDYQTNIKSNERVLKIISNSDGFEVITSKNSYSNIDILISAVPLFALNKILSESNLEIKKLTDFNYSPILSVHLWINENNFEKEFYGLIDSKIHWVFNHSDHLSIVISSANEFLHLSKQEIFEKIICELEIFFPMFSREHVLNFQVIKEKRATFIPDIIAVKKREQINVNNKNFYLAGDWTNTSLPGTIEGAIKSGRICAEVVKSNLQNNSLNK